MLFSTRLFLISCLSFGFTVVSESAPVSTKPERDFRIKGKVGDPQDLSGIAWVARNRAMLVGDEGGPATLLEVDREKGVLRVLDTYEIDPPGSTELDAEAVAVSGRFVYLVGSHGISRIKMQKEPGRYRVARFATNEHGIPTGVPSFFSLDEALQDCPLTRPYFETALQENGVNIEGAAIANDELFIGLRSPSLDGNLVILSTSLSGEYQRSWTLPVGVGYGIRAMEPTPDGFLLLTGAAGPDQELPSSVYLWNENGETLQHLGTLAQAKGKPEAMLYLGLVDGNHEILILRDSVTNGDPEVFLFPALR